MIKRKVFYTEIFSQSLWEGNTIVNFAFITQYFTSGPWKNLHSAPNTHYHPIRPNNTSQQAHYSSRDLLNSYFYILCFKCYVYFISQKSHLKKILQEM